MFRITGYLELSGSNFSPSQFERETGYVLRQKDEPGQIRTWGRFRGGPVPYGAGILDLDQSDPMRPMFELDAGIANLLISKAEILIRLGVTEKVIFFNVEHEEQCNLEITPSTLILLSRTETTVAITCYKS